MSLILDALKKSEKEREKFSDTETPPPSADGPSRGRRRPLILAGVVTVSAAGLAAFFLLREPGPVPPLAEAPADRQPAANTEAAAGVAEAEAQTEAEAKAEAKAQAEAQAEAKAKAEEEAKVNAEAEAKARAEADAEAKAKAEAKAEAEAKAKAEAKAEAEAKAKAEARAEAEAKEVAEARAAVAEAEAKEMAEARAAASRRQAGAEAGAYLKRGQAFEQEGLFDRAIEEYTQAILINPGLPEAYFGRAWAHESKGGHKQATKNFSQAIDLNPDYAEAYFGRGWAFEQQGQTDRAIGEYTQAIRSAPGYADAYFSRGILNFNQGRLNDAAGDFAGVYENAEGSLRDYALIWKFVSEARDGTDAGKARAVFDGLGNLDSLPGILISMLSEEATPGDVLATTKNPDRGKQLENECIAFFFLGQHRLIQGDKKGAREYFKKTLATGVTHYRQYAAAKSELARLGISN